MRTQLKQAFKKIAKTGSFTVILAFLLLCFANDAAAFLYGEHKLIGDLAFRQAMQRLERDRNAETLQHYLKVITGLKGSDYTFPGLAGDGASYRVTYGMLNGLSGDHESDPAVLELLLKDVGSRIAKIILLQQSYLDKGYKAAPDGELVKADFSYALQAAVNLSHFYAYGKSFQAQLKGFDLTQLKAVSEKNTLSAIVKTLGHTNAIRMYVSLHLLAVDMAEKAGELARSNQPEVGSRLQRALFLNAFADHFLEDAFSAGHLVVNRSMLASLTNNKALHDFYCEHGTMVVNRKGEIWRAYGDGYLDAENATGERIVRAVQLSVEDVFTAFNGSYQNPNCLKVLNRIPDSPEAQPGYLIGSLASLQLVPIPYNSDLKTVVASTVAVTDTMRKTNQLLYYRNFIRSRVGNSLVVGQLNTASRDQSLTGIELRANVLNFSKHYTYNALGGKKGMLDTWHGYTLAYQLAQAHDHSGFSTQFTGGLRSNFDYWLSDTRFLGLYSYLEGGFRFEKHQVDAVFLPAVGINLGSLFKINYYNMPGWLRVPVMYLLPLKVRYATEFTFRRPPEHQLAVELDLFF
jgi:hypothetical protein